MKVYVFIESESDDNISTYVEVFAKREDAVKRLEAVYYEETVERDESEPLLDSWISAGHESALVMYNNLSINWWVEEKEVF